MAFFNVKLPSGEDAQAFYSPVHGEGRNEEGQPGFIVSGRELRYVLIDTAAAYNSPEQALRLFQEEADKYDYSDADKAFLLTLPGGKQVLAAPATFTRNQDLIPATLGGNALNVSEAALQALGDYVDQQAAEFAAMPVQQMSTQSPDGAKIEIIYGPKPGHSDGVVLQGDKATHILVDPWIAGLPVQVACDQITQQFLATQPEDGVRERYLDNMLGIALPNGAVCLAYPMNPDMFPVPINELLNAAAHGITPHGLKPEIIDVLYKRTQQDEELDLKKYGYPSHEIRRDHVSRYELDEGKTLLMYPYASEQGLMGVVVEGDNATHVIVAPGPGMQRMDEMLDFMRERYRPPVAPASYSENMKLLRADNGMEIVAIPLNHQAKPMKITELIAQNESSCAENYTQLKGDESVILPPPIIEHLKEMVVGRWQGRDRDTGLYKGDDRMTANFGRGGIGYGH